MTIKKSKLQDRCTGHCCQDIGLMISPKIIETSYHNWILKNLYNDGLHVDRDCPVLASSLLQLCPQHTQIIQDIHLVYPMLVFLYEDDIHPDGGIQIKDKTIYHYSCKHFDKVKKICTIYEIRPRMCRTFPNNGFCGYEKCTCREFVNKRPKGWKYGMTIEEYEKIMKKDKK